MRYLILAALAAVVLAACSSGGDNNNSPTAGDANNSPTASDAATSTPSETAPSTEGDQLFHGALAALDQTQSLRYETYYYDADGNLTSTNRDEQVRPDRAHRVITDHVAGTTVDARIIGTRIVQIQPDGEELTADAPPGEAFSYPGTWQTEYGSLTGFSIVREETYEGRNAVVIAQSAPGGENGDLVDEQVIWIDRESGRILRWDSNQYSGDGDDRSVVTRSESSLWEYDQDVTVEFP